MNLLRIAKFEFRYQVVSLQGVCLALLLFGLGLLLTANGVEFQSTARGGNVFANAPYVIAHYLALLGVVTAMVGPPLLVDAALRDQSHRFGSLLVATTLSKTALYFGRYLGCTAALLCLLAAAPLGLYAGSYWPWAVDGTLGPNAASIYAQAYIYFLLPSVLLVSSVVFAMAQGTRSTLAAYLSGFALLALFIAVGSSTLFSDCMDPFMVAHLETATGHWTAFERNTQLPSDAVDVLVHRTLWGLVAASSLAIGYARYSPTACFDQGRTPLPPEPMMPASIDARILREAAPDWRQPNAFEQLWLRIRFEVRQVVLGWPFALLMGCALFLLASALGGRPADYGVSTYPVTRLMLVAIQEALTFALMAVLAFYSAELIWRERNCRFNEIIDALPVPNWVFVLSKLAALTLVLLAMVLLGIVIAIAWQWLSAYPDLQLGLYLRRGLIYFPLAYICLGILACFLQTLVKNRALGLILFFAVGGLLAASRDLLGIDHILLSYGLPGVAAPLSDMHPDLQLESAGWWARAYWGSMAGLLVLLTYLLWNRGTLQPMRFRLRAWRQLRSPRLGVAAGLLVATTLGSAAYIAYNVNVLNTYVTPSDVERLQLRFETEFGQYRRLPMPRITEVDIKTDLYPERGRVEVAADLLLRNGTAQPIDTIHLTFPLDARFDRVKLAGAQLRSSAPEFGYHIFALDRPMLPGATRKLAYRAVIQRQGFASGTPDLRLVRNGSFLNSSQFTPFIGVCDCMFVRDRDDRRRLGLPPLPRLPGLDSLAHHNQNLIRADSDFVRYRAIVSTSADQIAVAPGELGKQWREGSRRYFSYTMDTPMMNFYAILSADYAVARDRWNDVQIEVFHHAPHHYNVARMIASAKDSLGYYSQAFGPYPHRQLRIVEFPAYRKFAQAFPTTIPYSEDIGFLADVSAPGSFDLPYYIIAHEVAHQWWAHQVMAARVQGGTMLVESLAQYSALLVMEKRYGPHHLRPFLKAELDRYLSGRAKDDEGEKPLYRVEDQPYIHYRKGALVMYALKDYLGEDTVNRALKRLLSGHSYRSRPYALSTDLIAYLKQEADPMQHALIDDLLRRITLYDLRMEAAHAVALPDGRYRVRLRVSTAKRYADALGAETESALQLPIEVGLFLRNPADRGFSDDDVVVLSKIPIKHGVQEIALIVDRPPRFAGIDPYHKLIDRQAEDNMAAVQLQPGGTQVPTDRSAMAAP